MSQWNEEGNAVDQDCILIPRTQLGQGETSYAQAYLQRNNNNQFCYDGLVNLYTMRSERADICTNHNHNLTYANFCDNDNGIKTFSTMVL